MRNRIVQRAAEARSRRGVARVVLAGIVESHEQPGDVRLDEVKSLLVDAVRAWRARNGVREAHAAAANFVNSAPQAVHA